MIGNPLRLTALHYEYFLDRKDTSQPRNSYREFSASKVDCAARRYNRNSMGRVQQLDPALGGGPSAQSTQYMHRSKPGGEDHTTQGTLVQIGVSDSDRGKMSPSLSVVRCGAGCQALKPTNFETGVRKGPSTRVWNLRESHSGIARDSARDAERDAASDGPISSRLLIAISAAWRRWR